MRWEAEMPTIVEPTAFEKEERLQIPTPAGADCLVISGYAGFTVIPVNTLGGPASGELVGDEDDDSQWVPYTVHMVVGPKWLGVRDVSPIVTVAGYTFEDSDEADDSGYQVDTCTWDTVGLTEGQTEFERVRLKVDIRMRGGSGFSVTKLAYHLVVNGRL
jgi:hypothetical protein